MSTILAAESRSERPVRGMNGHVLTLELQDHHLDEMLGVGVADARVASFDFATLELESEGDSHVLERLVFAATGIFGQMFLHIQRHMQLTRQHGHRRCR